MTTGIKTSLDATSRELIRAAAESSTGRAAETVFGGHEKTLRQTVLALRAGQELSEHANPGEATVYVLSGRIRLVAGETSWHGRRGDFLVIPPERHSLEAVDESVVLLTVAKV